MRTVTVFFVMDMLRQTLRNLRHDGALLCFRTWRSAASFFFGREGLVRHAYKPWRAYFSLGFHPTQHGGELASQWLRDNSTQYVAVK